MRQRPEGQLVWNAVTGLTYGRRREVRYLSGVVVVALMVGVGCTANPPQPSPSPPCAAPGMREARPDERSMLSGLGSSRKIGRRARST